MDTEMPIPQAMAAVNITATSGAVYQAWQLGRFYAWSVYRDTADELPPTWSTELRTDASIAHDILDRDGNIAGPAAVLSAQLIAAVLREQEQERDRIAADAKRAYEDSTALASEELALRRKLDRMAPGGELNRAANAAATRVGHCPQYDRFITKQLGWLPRDVGQHYADRRLAFLDNMAKFHEDNRHLSELDRLRLLVSVYAPGGLLNMAANSWAQHNDISPETHNGMLDTLGMDWEHLEHNSSCYSFNVTVTRTRTVTITEEQTVTVTAHDYRDESDAWDSIDGSDVRSALCDYSWCEVDTSDNDDEDVEIDWDSRELHDDDAGCC